MCNKNMNRFIEYVVYRFDRNIGWDSAEGNNIVWRDLWGFHALCRVNLNIVDLVINKNKLCNF